MFFKNRNARRGHVVPASLCKRIFSIEQMAVGRVGKGIVLFQRSSAILWGAAVGAPAAVLGAFCP